MANSTNCRTATETMPKTMSLMNKPEFFPIKSQFVRIELVRLSSSTTMVCAKNKNEEEIKSKAKLITTGGTPWSIRSEEIIAPKIAKIARNLKYLKANKCIFSFK